MRKFFGFLTLAPVSGFIAAAILIACLPLSLARGHLVLETTQAQQGHVGRDCA